MPAVQATLGLKGFFEGLHYRGVPVIADVRVIPDSPWFIVARMDTEEVDAPLKERLWIMIFFFVADTAHRQRYCSGLWRQQRLRFYRALADSNGPARDENRYRRLFDPARRDSDT